MMMNSKPEPSYDFAELMADVEAMPVCVEQALKANLRYAQVSLPLFVPEQAVYYERLIGRFDTDLTAEGYVDKYLGPMINGMVLKYGAEGFKRTLLNCSHSRIASHIPIEALNHEEVISTYSWLAEQGDPISQTGSVEVALRKLSKFPELEPLVELIVRSLIVVPDGVSSQYELFSALFKMIAGGFARKRTLGAAPPFYRRQAALAQASVSIRAVMSVMQDANSFIKWVNNTSRSELYFLQGLVDLRPEPRWLPEYVLPAQMKAESLVCAGLLTESVTSPGHPF